MRGSLTIEAVSRLQDLTVGKKAGSALLLGNLYGSEYRFHLPEARLLVAWWGNSWSHFEPSSDP